MVSILEVMIRLGETTFQSNEVIGAVCSGDFELESSASGDSFWSGASEDLRVMVLLAYACWSCGRDQRRRWSPEVASRSVVCLLEDGGSHKILVTGYECVASAVFVNSKFVSPCIVVFV